MRLIPVPPGKIVSGEVIFNGKDLIKASEAEIMKIRGNEIAMIFQDPMTSLNPVLTVGEQIMEAIVLHQKVSRSEAKKRAIEMLKKGQRVMIAMALSCNYVACHYVN